MNTNFVIFKDYIKWLEDKRLTLTYKLQSHDLNITTTNYTAITTHVLCKLISLQLVKLKLE